MNKKLMTFWIIASMVMALLAAPFSSASLWQTKTVGEMRMFQATKFDAHYRVPRDGDIINMLEKEEVIRNTTDGETAYDAVQEFKSLWHKRNPDTPNPVKLRQLLEAARNPEMAKPATPIKSLVVPVEFAGTDTFDWCETGEDTFIGPMHNEIPKPGPLDNNTAWYEDSTPDLYNNLYFGIGQTSGVVVDHPNLGPVDLRGFTMANYYLEQSDWTYMPAGMVYPSWIEADHSEAYYGQDSCDGGNHNINARELVVEVLGKVVAASPNFAWQSFDGDGDGIVDNFTVIHSGMGQEAGGGAQGDFSIWSHASLVNWPSGYKVCTAGATGCPDRDIFVREYSMDPEHIDIGVISEEFGHAAFGLPDMYATDFQGSIANWAIMEAGSWNGILGGMMPAPFPLYFRMLVGWAHPLEIPYGADPTEVTIGQLTGDRVAGTEDGIKINLPPKHVVNPNPLDTGNAWWSTKGDVMDNKLSIELDLTAATAPVFSFNSYWDTEEDWDGGYFEVSTDGGTTWTALPDEGGYFTDSTMNGNNPDGNWVLTGYGEDILSFDLSAYAGQTIQVRMRYATDLAVSYPGWWGDDFSLDDGATNLFADDVEGDTSAWTTDTWKVVPYEEEFDRYYLVEWRNKTGFDVGLNYPYHTTYNDEDEWQVDRAPYSTPGALLYFVDDSYLLDYTLGDAWYDEPSYGPKHGISVIDAHPFPRMWSNHTYTSTGANVRLSDRIQPGDATFSLTPTSSYTLHFTPYNFVTGITGPGSETKTFDARDPVSVFDDSLGYYPGLWFRPANGSLVWWNIAASAVVPAKGPYTTRITDSANNPFPALYGYDLGDTILGTGNPGDSDVEFGIHFEVTEQAADGTWGTLNVWNAPTMNPPIYLPLVVQP